MLTNCFRFAPRDSVPGLINKICKYLKEHPGWSAEEIAEEIQKFVETAGVESFNGRTGVVTLNKDDVNSLNIALAYFAEGDETIDSLDLPTLYAQGIRFVLTNFNSVTSGYDLTFVLEFYEASGDVVYYPLASGGSSGGSVLSVNGKTGVVEIDLADVLGDSGAQVKLCTATEFSSTAIETWNAYYESGYRIVGVVNDESTTVDYIYILKQDENNHQPIGLSTGASDAYTPTNPPPYPVSGVNDKTGDVELKVVDVSEGDSSDPRAAIFVVEGENYPSFTASDASKLGGKAWSELMLEIYPVGVVYISAYETSPARLFGGTWERLKDRFLLGAGDSYAAGAKGGASEVALTEAEIAVHRHSAALYSVDWVDPDHQNVINGVVNAAQYGRYSASGGTQFRGATSDGTYAGGGKSHNNMPPYLAVYMWRRVK